MAAGFEGRVALVTGASQGIGRAIALELASVGVMVALAARNEARLAEVKAEIETTGGKAESFALDVSSEDSIKTTAKEIVAKLGAVHILVNNAGVTRDGLVLRMKSTDWDDVLNTNLKGAFLVTQALLQPMMKARWGRVINITSVVGEMGQAGQANYAASKAGLIGLTKSLAREFASRGITVNAVAPGFIETDMTHVLTDDQKNAMLGAVPLARAGTVADIAAAVRFLASDGAGYITGHTLNVNGGLYMS
jgi:3-oxoacyl-[acyl-carrier protein] reductase